MQVKLSSRPLTSNRTTYPTAASVPGLLMLGYLSDKIPLRIVISLSCFGSALSCILLWGFATNAGVLVAFVVLFGLLGLSFSALWTKLITVIARESRFGDVQSTISDRG
jgi:MFS family permease